MFSRAKRAPAPEISGVPDLDFLARMAAHVALYPLCRGAWGETTPWAGTCCYRCRRGI